MPPERFRRSDPRGRRTGGSRDQRRGAASFAGTVGKHDRAGQGDRQRRQRQHSLAPIELLVRQPCVRHGLDAGRHATPPESRPATTSWRLPRAAHTSPITSRHRRRRRRDARRRCSASSRSANSASPLRRVERPVRGVVAHDPGVVAASLDRRARRPGAPDRGRGCRRVRAGRASCAFPACGSPTIAGTIAPASPADRASRSSPRPARAAR